MITEADLAHWRRIVPWSTDQQVEQDLVLSRLIIEIANHPLLGTNSSSAVTLASTNSGWHATFVGGDRLQVKVEMNTFERSPAQPVLTRPMEIDSPWFSGGADVATFTLEELIATKIRALYQRRKGRDLFDMWLAVEHGGATPAAIAGCFPPYRPEGWSVALALDNLAEKLDDDRFATDLSNLVTDWPTGYSITAGAAVVQTVLDDIDASASSSR